MFISPDALRQQLADELQTFAAYLQSEFEEQMSSQQLSPHERRCKEALLTIKVLLAKLRALELRDATSPRAPPACLNCE